MTATRSRQAVLAGVSGPDGSGKTSLVRALAARLAERGFAVVTAYCYGCFICRRATGPGAARGGGDGRGWSWPSRAHAVLDAAELTARLARARRQAAALARRWGGPAVVVTDRGPLDALAKFDPPAGSAAAALFAWISREYDLTLLLDAPPEVLARRGQERSAEELAGWRERYRRWARGRLKVTPLHTDLAPPRVLADVAAAGVAAKAGRDR